MTTRTRRWLLVLFIGVFLFGVANNARRIDAQRFDTERPGAPDTLGFQDFRDTVFSPVRDLLHGHDPYDPDGALERNPGEQPFSLYLPAWLLLVLPVALLPIESGAVVWFLILVAGFVAFVRLVLRATRIDASWPATFALAGVLMLSANGRNGLFFGQAAVYVSCGVALALLYQHTRPLVAAIGVAVALLKPQFGLPLLVLLCLGWRSWRVAVSGVVIAFVASLVPLGLAIANAGGVSSFADHVSRNLEYNNDDYAGFLAPDKDGVREDAAAGVQLATGRDVAELMQVVAAVVFLGASIVLLRLRGPSATDPLAIVLSALAILLSTVHIDYDGVLLALPVAVVVKHVRALRPVGWVILAAVLLPSVVHQNFVQRTLERLGVGSTAIRIVDPLMLTVAFAVAAYGILTVRQQRATAVAR